VAGGAKMAALAGKSQLHTEESSLNRFLEHIAKLA